MKVLKFGAVWCPGCLVMRPRWKEIETENPWLKNDYYDFDQDKEMVQKYQIDKNLPVFVFLDKEGEEFLRLSGEQPKAKLVDIVTQNRDK